MHQENGNLITSLSFFLISISKNYICKILSSCLDRELPLSLPSLQYKLSNRDLWIAVLGFLVPAWDRSDFSPCLIGWLIWYSLAPLRQFLMFEPSRLRYPTRNHRQMLRGIRCFLVFLGENVRFWYFGDPAQFLVRFCSALKILSSIFSGKKFKS